MLTYVDAYNYKLQAMSFSVWNHISNPKICAEKETKYIKSKTQICIFKRK
jgi:hypothetical protein